MWKIHGASGVITAGDRFTKHGAVYMQDFKLKG